MSQPYPPPYQPPARKPRPKARWFVVGGVLMVVGLVAGGVLFVTAITGVLKQDGVVAADGQPARVDAPAGKKRMLFVESGHAVPQCRVTDGSGQALQIGGVSGDVTVTVGSREWKGFGTLESSGDGRLTLACAPTAGDQTQVRVGAPLDFGGVGARVVLAVGIILVLGGAGFVVLLVTTILWVSRKPATVSPA